MRMKTIRYSVIVSLLIVIAVTYGFLQLRQESQRIMSEDPRVWEEAIAAFEKQDKKYPSAPNTILFLGSSSIRLWHSMVEDMLPLRAVNRGFGGAKILDLSYFANRLVTPHRPGMIVVYIGSNDFSVVRDKQLQDVQRAVKLYQQLFERLKNAAPEVPIAVIALKPTLKNTGQWLLIKQVNQHLAAFAADDDQLHYIDANAELYTLTGEVNSDLLRFDGVHLNSDGYQVWGQAIKAQLIRLLAE